MGYHRPVLLCESVEGLNIRPDGIYVDLTFGGGGHSREVLNKLGRKGRLIAFDQDRDAGANVPADKRISFVRANFRYLRNFLRYHKVDSVDGILADLGISSHQIDRPERGFSFRADAALDMRMDQESGRTAADILNGAEHDELAGIFRLYGELKNAGAIAGRIVQARTEAPIRTTGDLEAALGKLVPARQAQKFLAKLYQALRIQVNQEMEALREMLLQTASWTAEGGRLVVISYHSIEDRLVKNYMKSGNTEGEVEKDFYGNVLSPWRMVNRTVIRPSEEEVEANNRARSARLRIAERVNNGKTK